MCNCLLDRGAPPDEATTRDLALGVVVTENSKGVRLEFDVLEHRGWSLAVALGVATSSWRFADAMSSVALVYEDLATVAVLAKTFTRGPWRLRLQAGAGLYRTDYSGAVVNMFVPSREVDDTTGLLRLLEVGATIAYDVDAAWSVAAGPLFTHYAQSFTIDDGIEQHAVGRDYEVGAWVTLRKHL